jgi:(S)-2-hydroxyglutarate dehydrogenase
MMYDIAVIGGGIVGLSFAMQAIQQFPRLHIIVLEKEEAVARHQSGHNSGVIHSGIYYKPGSMKARMCVTGAREMLDFCLLHRIPHKICGKLIVATNSTEIARLDKLFKQGVANGLEGLRLLGREAMLAVEPQAGGMQALHVPSAAITDYVAVTSKYAEIAGQQGAEIKMNAAVMRFHSANNAVAVCTRAGDFSARYVVNCAGLYSDRIARIAGHDPKLIIVPFRGEYYDLIPACRKLVRGLIYPLPDPRYPFLGIHLTLHIEGGVDAGPNAVVAFRREGYRFNDFNFGELWELVQHEGFRSLVRRDWRNGIAEFRRSLRKQDFLRSCQRLLPAIQMGDLIPGGSGVRAQAVDLDGTLIEDFRFGMQDRFLHVLNVPSPAATASLPIGREILKMLPTEIVQ